jgi:ubiquitin C-terminal hydrolase
MLRGQIRRVAPEDRDLLVKNLGKIQGVTATIRAIRVAVVEKRWHDGLVAWLTLPMMPPPGPIAAGFLCLHDRMTRGLDFELFDYSLWETLTKVLGPARPFFCQYVIHPATKQPTLLRCPVQPDFDLDGRLMRKSCGGNWIVRDAKNQLCEAIGISGDDYDLWLPPTKIDESITVSEALAKFTGAWQLKKKPNAPPNTDTGLSDAAQVTPISSPPIHVQPPPIATPRPVASAHPKHTGLRNLGNTCFFNSAVQCLARICPLVDFCMSDTFDDQINSTNPAGSGGRIATAFRDLVKQMCHSKAFSVSPTKLHSEICRKYPMFGNFGQHDSQELLGALLDCLHEDLNHPRGHPSTGVNGDPWDVHLSRNASPVLDIFHGCLGSTIECPKCQFRKVVRDPFSILSLPIPKQTTRTVTLESCLESFARSEVLDRNNQWKCEHCKRFVQATKRISVHKSSKVLILHFKRFEGRGFWSKKVTTSVSYPDVLDTNIISGHGNGARYKLIGAVFHGGTLYGGHYTAAVLDQSENQWYAYNDSCGSAISAGSAYSDKAYILFYEKL